MPKVAWAIPGSGWPEREVASRRAPSAARRGQTATMPRARRSTAAHRPPPAPGAVGHHGAQPEGSEDAAGGTQGLAQQEHGAHEHDRQGGPEGTGPPQPPRCAPRSAPAPARRSVPPLPPGSTPASRRRGESSPAGAPAPGAPRRHGDCPAPALPPPALPPTGRRARTGPRTGPPASRGSGRGRSTSPCPASRPRRRPPPPPSGRRATSAGRPARRWPGRSTAPDPAGCPPPGRR